MSFPAPIAVLFALSLFPASSVAQPPQSSPAAPASGLVPGIHGTVLTVDGRPASNIHIELDNASTALPVTSTSTQSDGTFELYNIPAGDYELVAESVDSRADDPIAVQSGDAQLKLRLQHDAPPSKESEPIVSVVHMMVPESAQKLYRKAMADVNNHKPDKAMPLLDSALLIEPRFADALSLRGLIEMGDGKLAAAQDDLERAVQIDPAYANAYIGLGAIYNHEGRFDDAMRVSERSLSLSPNSWQAYFEMAKATIAKGMYVKGLQLARQAQRLSGNSFAAVHLIKAYALVPMKLYKDAKYELQAFLSREPNSKSAQQAQTLLAQIDAATVAASAAH
ncbi:MAG TPA: tetratricopeptide repeat protein [Verrucomicrobiae bacterium]|jgi:tetratricopeptide (TPR) repeat protein|nr:tetratricopeptide repeat protein [Verrucomicrobiae bacterium]